MAELGGHAEASAAQLVADDDAAAEAGAERDADDVVVALAGPEAVFAPGRGVGVVLDDDGQADALLDLVLERLVTPVDVRCEQDGGALVVDVTGGADADGLHVVALARPGDRRADRVDDAFGRRRGRHLERREDPALFVDHSSRDLRAADIDADGESHESLSFGRAPLGATVPEAAPGTAGAGQSRSMRSVPEGPSSRGSDGSSAAFFEGPAVPDAPSVVRVQRLSWPSTAER